MKGGNKGGEKKEGGTEIMFFKKCFKNGSY